MHRRLLIASAACLAATRLLAQEAGQAHRKISATVLRQALAARFPLGFSVPGLFHSRVDAGDFVLLPQRQRLGTTLLATVKDLSTGRVYTGDLALTFALRYDAADRTVRAHRIELARLRSPELPPDAAGALQALLDGVVRNAVAEVVLHRFSPEELQFTDVMGLQPGKLTIEPDGVEVWFEPRQSPGQ